MLQLKYGSIRSLSDYDNVTLGVGNYFSCEGRLNEQFTVKYTLKIQSSNI